MEREALASLGTIQLLFDKTRGLEKGSALQDYPGTIRAIRVIRGKQLQLLFNKKAKDSTGGDQQ